jgi:uncharacterized protein involved in response to NO
LAFGPVRHSLSVHFGLMAAALIDVAFLATLAASAARETFAGRNWRNLRVWL